MPRVVLASLALFAACHTSAPPVPEPDYRGALLAVEATEDAVCRRPPAGCGVIVVDRSVRQTAEDLPVLTDRSVAFQLPPTALLNAHVHWPLEIADVAMDSTPPSGKGFAWVYVVTRATSDTLRRFIVALWWADRRNDVAYVNVARSQGRWRVRRISFLQT